MVLSGLMAAVGHRLMRSSSAVTLLRRPSIVYRRLRLLLRRLSMEIWNTVRVCWSPVGLIGMSLIVVRMAIIAPGWLRYVRYHLHTSWNNACGTTATGGVR